MPFENLPTYADEDLERKAAELLQERYPAGVPVPIDVEWLLETTPGVDFDCYPALRANHAIEGGVWAGKQTGELLVCVDEALMDDDSKKGVARYRWAVAESSRPTLRRTPPALAWQSCRRGKGAANE